LGWAFKKDTNDTRESAAIYVADVLLDEGAEVHVYDPMVDQAKIHHDLSLLWESKNNSTEEIQSKLERCVVHENHMEATHGSFAVAILTEWDEFIEYPWDLIVSNMMRPTKVYDGRNIITNNQHLTNIVESIGN